MSAQEADEAPGWPLREIVPSEGLPIVHPDQPLEEALRVLDNWPALPVVSRANLRKLEGVISLSDILEAYRKSTEK